MTKVNGSLGFTLRKEDHSALGHYVRALVREPALSDGRIQPGDRIVAVSISAIFQPCDEEDDYFSQDFFLCNRIPVNGRPYNLKLYRNV